MEEKGMDSFAEYIRAMVAAGQKEFSTVAPFEDSNGESMQQQIKQELDTDSYTTWEELIEGLTENIEVEVEDSLTQMEETGAVEHSPRKGGWKLNEY
jgi:hypothetical protein